MEIIKINIMHTFQLSSPRSVEIVLFFHFLEICLFLLSIHLLKCLIGLVIQYNQISVNPYFQISSVI